jgi:hypothetical protein
VRAILASVHSESVSATTAVPSSSASRASRLWHAGVAVVVGVALVLQLVLVIAYPEDSAPDSAGVRVLRFFSFFTVQSNILVLIAAITLARNPGRDGRVWRVLRLDAVLAITVTGVVHYVALRPIQDLEGWDSVADILLHVVSPIIVLAGWLLFGPRPRISWRDVGLSAIWPVLWLVYTLIAGELGEWYPYPFVDVDIHGYGVVLLNSAVVTVIFLALAAAGRFLDRTLRPAP